MTDPARGWEAEARALCLDAGWCDRCECPQNYSVSCEHAGKIAIALQAAFDAGVAQERARWVADIYGPNTTTEMPHA